jgi:hypothetical protein
MKSAAGEASKPTAHAPAANADTPSDSAAEDRNVLKEKETGLFKALSGRQV